MNVKPGDLAVIVRGAHRPAIGKFCRVIHAVGGYGCPMWQVELDSPLHVEGEVITDGHAPDSYLRPIRPGDISDEEVRDLYSDKQKEAA